MKTSRLLSIVLLLQTRGRMTTSELARHFEVSRRTILRDIEALSTAGIPVFTERGRHGAVVLDSRARLDLARLDPAELQFLGAMHVDADRLDQVGLREVSSRTREKMSAAAGRRHQDGRGVDDVLLIDSSGWASAASDQDLTEVCDAARARRRVRVTYRHSGSSHHREYLLDVYGVVWKQAAWYVVADVSGVPRMFNASRLGRVEVLGESASLREGETLTSVWAALLSRQRETATVQVTAEVRASRLDLASRIIGARLVATAEPVDGWVRITVAYEQLEGVRQLLQFGDHIRVTDPPDAVCRVRELADVLVANHPEREPAPASTAKSPGCDYTVGIHPHPVN